ncbi:NADPH-dependent FMN reductase [Vreelandella neptunia]|uniref:NAD(P)H-dependent oxidoreductase n=1 Tax=Vreelandella neptunia TaxID=115551 RepID=A0ABZ0YGX4_9GAMM|nr:NAD(P)H-dependent oxidoreductase [Halomonas neptunia]MDN3561378.1 NAD(P)H-dependent oxidoreductase [Halomonas neptunia]TDV93594.1 NAD(P)H-dependent FMN reductase [Halomonas alkaliantarctica]WQH10983.1 NAD(P)H-dependent oxidoreductase [Halomonas neptunia]
MAHYLVFLGSTRTSRPPSPARLGERVAKACERLLSSLPHTAAEIIDPLALNISDPFKPHFAYAKNDAPEDLAELADKIAAADGYVMVSPEYNHSMSPALSHLLNHFGASLFAFKPSAIVTYSMGQWGGVRAGVAMRAFLSELGCLPVSAMIHIPKAQEALNEDGQFAHEQERWESYFGRTLGQLMWWAEAAASYKKQVDPTRVSPAFKTAPSQRNAPGSESS